MHQANRALFLVLALLLLPAVLAHGALAAADDKVTLNFKDADVDAVVGAFGHLMKRTFIIDPRVRGKMTLETPQPISREQAYQMLQTSLRMQGFAIVESGGIGKVVPEADAKLQAGPVTSGRPARGGDQVVTQIFKLQYESASNLVPVLRPLISPNNTVTAYPNNNSLVVTDYAANVQRIARIVAGLDTPSTNELEVVPIKHAMATDVALTVARMLDDQNRAGAGAQVDGGQKATVLADTRTNSVMVRAASPAKVNLAKALILRLDQPSVSPGNIHVVYLRNAEAVRLAQTLRAVLSGGASADAFGTSGALGTQTGMSAGLGTNPGGAPGQQPGQQPGALGSTAANAPLQNSSQSQNPVSVVAGGAIIAADPATNSLIVTAPEHLFRNLRSVIDRLDARRAQVHIESLIVEISSEKAAEVGVQWQALNPGSGSTRVIGGTNLPSRGTGSNILDVATNVAAMGQGLNLGIVRGTVNVAGTEILNLGVLARALESNSSANVLATPNLLTLDNEEARIIIGQNVPFVTGQFTLPGAGGGAVNPFQTVERKDVGTTLRVKPQVSEAGTVRLQIFQEVSSVQDRTLSAGLITNRRAIESNVLVDDGQIVVLGGLIEERIEGADQKVPGLGDVPFIGNLFRYDSRKKIKTNLLVFLRPVVIRDAEGAYGVTSDRYDYMRQLRGDSTLPSRLGLPDLPPKQLPAITPPGIQVVPAGAASQPGAEPSPEGNAAGATVPSPGDRPRPVSNASGVTSLSPDLNRVPKQAPAAVVRSRPTLIQVNPNEPLVPLNQGNPAPATADPSRPAGGRN